MNRIFVFPLNSTYLSSKSPHTNFFHSNVLKIDKYHNLTQYTLLNFPLNICSTEHSLKWYLYLPLNKINRCYDNNALSVNIIYSHIKYNSIKYHDLGKLCINNFCNAIIDKTSVYEKNIMIDVSFLVYQCLNTGESSFHIMLGALSNNLSLHFNKNNLNELPRLIVEDVHCCNSYNNQVAIDLRLNPTSKNRVICKNDVIKFNDISAKTPNGIAYNAEKGEIRVLRKGYYTFHWNFSIEGSTYIDTPSIGLRNNKTGILLPYPAPKSIQCQISGMALVDVNELSTSFSLINLSNGNLLLSDIEPCASLIVNRI